MRNSFVIYNFGRICGARLRSTLVDIDYKYSDVDFQDISNKVRPYSEIPGPKQLPIIGNSWRFAPFIGMIFSFKRPN